MIDNEAGSVLCANPRVAQLPCECQKLLDNGGIGFHAADDFDDLHQRDGIEEVKACYPVGVLQAGSDRGDGERRGIGRQNGVLGNDTLQFRKQGVLGLKVFNDRFDHQITVGELIQCIDNVQVGDRRVSCGGGHLSLAGEPAQGVNQFVACSACSACPAIE